MSTAARGLLGLLLLAHGLVHLLYLAPDVDAFSLETPWLPDGLRRPVALVLLSATVLSFTLLALAVWGVPRLSADWPILALVAAWLSAVTLMLFWDPQLVLGLLIDATIVVLAVWQPGWLQQLVQGVG